MGSKPKNPAISQTPKLGNRPVDDALLKECEDVLDKLMEQQVEVGGSFEDYEQALLRLVHELARRKLEKKLQSVADSFAPRLAIEHSEDWYGWREDTVFKYRRHAPGTLTYHSLVGSLRVKRFTYRECGALSTHVPLELAAGLMERMTPALARCVAVGYAHVPPRIFEEILGAGAMRLPSRSTIDRTARDLGAYAVACNSLIEPLIRANERLPAGTRRIALGLDRVAVPMRHGEELQGVAAYDRDLRRSRPAPKPRSELRGPVQWRMDYVATVAFLDGDGEVLGSRKYRLPGESNIAGIVERVMADVRAAMVQSPIEVVVIQDGAPELWSAIADALRAEPLVPDWTEVLDWYHLDERLAKCLDLSTDAANRERQSDRWHAALLDEQGGARHVIRSLRQKARSLDPTAAQDLTGHVGYLERNKHRTSYCDYRSRGIPIGSGVTEGACKSLVNVRAKRSGQRWSQRGLTAVLHLRAMHESDRFDAFWSVFSRRYRATHIVALD